MCERNKTYPIGKCPHGGSGWRIHFFAVLIFVAFGSAQCTCGSLNNRCTPGELSECVCPDGSASYQQCASNGRYFEDCVCDPDWQQRDVDISVNPAHAVFTVENMAPGDETTGSVIVSNSAEDAFRYSVTSNTTENALSAKLEMTMTIGYDKACNSVGSNLYGPGILGTTDGIMLIGDPLPGYQPGDRVLEGGATEFLCLTIVLPIETENMYQGLATTMTLAFPAEALEE